MKYSKYFKTLQFFSHMLIPLLIVGLIPKFICAQQQSYPAMISFNYEIGFIIDSTEMRQNDLFPFVPRENISYLVVIQKDAVAYDLIVVYKNGDNTLARYGGETIKKEWQKTLAVPIDSSRISDYSTAKQLFPEVMSFVVMDSTFNRVTYEYGSGNINKSAWFFAELCGNYVHMLEDANLPAFHMNTSIVFGNAIVSGFWIYGQTRSREIVNAFVNTGPSTQYKYREIGLTGGWVIANRFVIFSISSGVSQIKYQIIRSESNGNSIFLPNYIRVSNKEAYELGIPLCLDFSFPAFSGAGLSLKARTTFIYQNEPIYNLGVGIRLGRTSTK